VDFVLGDLRPWGQATSPDEPVQSPAQDPAWAWCGLGHPEAFYADLLLAGHAWVGTHSFPDHKGPTPADLRRLQAQARAEGARWLVCTEKDAVKLDATHAAALEMPLLVAEQHVAGGAPLLEWVLARLA
jgi:tetraacyldisaccharide 4'-kinase